MSTSQVVSLRFENSVYDQIKSIAGGRSETVGEFVRLAAEERLGTRADSGPARSPDAGIILEALIEDLRGDIIRLKEVISTNQLTREEIFSGISILAKYTPEIKGQYDRYFAQMKTCQNAQVSAHNGFVDALDASTQVVKSAEDSIGSLFQAAERARRSISDVHSGLEDYRRRLWESADLFSKQISKKLILLYVFGSLSTILSIGVVMAARYFKFI